MYAITIYEPEYPCGNVFGIFDDLEKANESIKSIFKNKEITINIVKINLNKLVKESLTGCADCMTRVKII